MMNTLAGDGWSNFVEELEMYLGCFKYHTKDVEYIPVEEIFSVAKKCKDLRVLFSGNSEFDKIEKSLIKSLIEMIRIDGLDACQLMEKYNCIITYADEEIDFSDYNLDLLETQC